MATNEMTKGCGLSTGAVLAPNRKRRRGYSPRLQPVSTLRTACLEYFCKLLGSDWRMNRSGPGIVSIGKGANITCSHLEIIQRPVTRCPHIARYLDKPGRNSREERYLEMIEGYRQPISNRFDVR